MRGGPGGGLPRAAAVLGSYHDAGKVLLPFSGAGGRRADPARGGKISWGALRGEKTKGKERKERKEAANRAGSDPATEDGRTAYNPGREHLQPH